MRLIKLDRTGLDKTYLESVLKHGCGPSFIRNRADAFEQMIREQVSRDVPGLISCLFRGLHYHFVQASNEEAITYCWNIIFASGAPTKRVFDEMYQFLEVAFGCALGEVFFKWLHATDVGSHSKKQYWTVPKKYLDPNFKPGFLEIFLLYEWGNKFFELLGVTKQEIPWIKKFLHIPLHFFEDRKGMSAYHLEYTRSLIVKNCLEGWKLKLKTMKSAIQQADYKRQLAESDAPKKRRKNKVRFLLSNIRDISENQMDDDNDDEDYEGDGGDDDNKSEFDRNHKGLPAINSTLMNTTLMNIFPDEPPKNESNIVASQPLQSNKLNQHPDVSAKL